MDKVCGNCRWWGVDHADSCDRVGSDDRFRFVVAGDGWQSVRLVTSADFSCAAFDVKVDDDESLEV